MSNVILFENFNDDKIDNHLKWFSPPREWSIDPNICKLIIKTDKETDFWQKTHYDFRWIYGSIL